MNSGLLLRRLLKEKVYRPDQGWWLLLLRVILANGVMGAVLYYGAGYLDWTSQGFAMRWVWLILWIGLGGTAYAGCLFLFGVRPRHLMGLGVRQGFQARGLRATPK